MRSAMNFLVWCLIYEAKLGVSQAGQPLVS